MCRKADDSYRAKDRGGVMYRAHREVGFFRAANLLFRDLRLARRECVPSRGFGMWSAVLALSQVQPAFTETPFFVRKIFSRRRTDR